MNAYYSILSRNADGQKSGYNSFFKVEKQRICEKKSLKTQLSMV